MSIKCLTCFFNPPGDMPPLLGAIPDKRNINRYISIANIEKGCGIIIFCIRIDTGEDSNGDDTIDDARAWFGITNTYLRTKSNICI